MTSTRGGAPSTWPDSYPGTRVTVDVDPLTSIGVQVYDVAAQHVESAQPFVGYDVGAVLIGREALALHSPVAATLSCARAGAASVVAILTVAKTTNLFISLLLPKA